LKEVNMTLSFSARTNCTCDECSHLAYHGFFASYADDPDGEIFLCSGCAQKTIEPHYLEAAIEEHRQLCFERAEEEARLENVYLDWINGGEEEAIAC
jgi:hypothetical protein